MKRSVALIGLLATCVPLVVTSPGMVRAGTAVGQCGWDSAIGNPGTGSSAAPVRAMTEFDVDGDGVPELIVGGAFNSMNGLDWTNNVAAWKPAAHRPALRKGQPE